MDVPGLTKSTTVFVIPQSYDLQNWEIVLEAQGRRFRLYIQLNDNLNQPNDPWYANVHLSTDRENSVLFTEAVLQILRKRLQQTDNVRSFAVECQAVLAQVLRDKSTVCDQLAVHSESFTESFKFVDYSKKILSEIDEVEWIRVSFVSESFDEVHVGTHDSAGRSHRLTFKTDPKTWEDVKVIADIPGEFAVVGGVLGKDQVFRNTLSQLKLRLKDYQVFWDQMDDLDSNCWIIEPEKPNRADLTRRVLLSQRISICISVDPLRSQDMPQVQFLGPEKDTVELKKTMLLRSHMWDGCKHSVRENLEIVLNVQLPARKMVEAEEGIHMTCPICLYYRKDDVELPEVICDTCQHSYHKSCLLEWIQEQQNVVHFAAQASATPCLFCKTELRVE